METQETDKPVENTGDTQGERKSTPGHKRNWTAIGVFITAVGILITAVQIRSASQDNLHKTWQEVAVEEVILLHGQKGITLNGIVSSVKTKDLYTDEFKGENGELLVKSTVLRLRSQRLVVLSADGRYRSIRYGRETRTEVAVKASIGNSSSSQGRKATSKKLYIECGGSESYTDAWSYRVLCEVDDTCTKVRARAYNIVNEAELAKSFKKVSEATSKDGVGMTCAIVGTIARI